MKDLINKEYIKNLVLKAFQGLEIQLLKSDIEKIEVTYPDFSFGDFTINAAMIAYRRLAIATDSHVDEIIWAGKARNPRELAEKIIRLIDKEGFEKIEVAGPGFINFRLKDEVLLGTLKQAAKSILPEPIKIEKKEKILVEYFQPNIAKPLHIGHMCTAIIGDSLSRMLKFLGFEVESDTHMGDWGTQFGLLILAFKKFGNPKIVEQDPINELNKLYIRINEEMEKDKSILAAGKQEFVKLEQNDGENKKIWKQFVDWSMERFLRINDLLDIQPFDHHWPESFYEDKMPGILEKLKSKGLLIESQGAQIVNLENQGLGIAIIIKSDGGTTYLLRDLATFIYRKSLGFAKQIYVVDVRQAHAFKQLFAILSLIGEFQEGEGVHVDYGFMSFSGSVLSTRKGNMVLIEDVLRIAEEKVAKIIEEKNSDLLNKQRVVKAVAKGAIKYFQLMHNRHSDIEFNWDKALDFEGNSGPYLQYTYARFASILRKEQPKKLPTALTFSETERQIMFELSVFKEKVEEAIKEYMPNVLVAYIYNLAGLLNRFYHENPVLKEPNEEIKQFRLNLIIASKNVLGKGLDLLGIVPLEEM